MKPIKTYNLSCPYCDNHISIVIGTNNCPQCKQIFVISQNFFLHKKYPKFQFVLLTIFYLIISAFSFILLPLLKAIFMIFLCMLLSLFITNILSFIYNLDMISLRPPLVLEWRKEYKSHRLGSLIISLLLIVIIITVIFIFYFK
jgi:hypothetical protein